MAVGDRKHRKALNLLFGFLFLVEHVYTIASMKRIKFMKLYIYLYLVEVPENKRRKDRLLHCCILTLLTMHPVVL